MEDIFSSTKCKVLENGDILVEKLGEYQKSVCPFKDWNCNVNCQLAIPIVYVAALGEYKEGEIKQQSHMYKQYIFIKCGCETIRLSVT